MIRLWRGRVLDDKTMMIKGSYSTWGWGHGQHTVPGVDSWTTHSTWGWVHGQHTVPGVGFMDNIQYLGVDSWTTHSTWGWVHGQHTVPGGGFRDNTQYLACWDWVQRHTSTPWCPFSSPHRQHHGNIKSGVGHSPPVLAENVHKNIKI